MLNSSVNLSAGEVIWKKGFGEWKSPSYSKDILQWLGSVIWVHQLWMPFHARSCSSCWRKKGLSGLVFFLFFFQGIKNEFHYDPSGYSQQWVQTTQHIYKINAQESYDSKTWNKAKQDNCLTSGLLKI